MLWGAVVRVTSILLALLTVTAPAWAQVRLEPYVLSTFDGKQEAAEIGRLKVPENRAASSGPTIDLAFIRLKSRNPSPDHPIVFLAGGPGVPGSVMGRVPVYFELFDRLRQVADVILLDQRGTGLSVPSLECPRDGDLPADLLESADRAIAALTQTVRACASHWRSLEVDPAAYTTVNSADDLEDLRGALGAERLSLIGFSYGGELALAAIRRHGNSVHRAVLASPRAPDNVIKLPSVLDSQTGRIASLVTADPIGRQLVPDSLPAAIGQLLERLDKEPITVTIGEPGEAAEGGRPRTEIKVGKIGLQIILQDLLGDGRRVPLVPALLHTLRAGDPSLFAQMIGNLYNGLRRGGSLMSVSMDCSAGWSGELLTRIQSEEPGSLLGNAVNLRLQPSICDIVGNPGQGPDYRQPVTSPVPALFLSGELDLRAAPAQVEEIRSGFSNSHHIVVKNGFHESLPSTQVQSLVVDFFKGVVINAVSISVKAPNFLTVEEAKARR